MDRVAQQASNFRAIEEGQTALSINPAIVAFTIERRDAIVRDLISRYRAKQLTDNDLWGAVGALAELDTMLADIERKVTKRVLAEGSERKPAR